MSEDHKKTLQTQLWNIEASTLGHASEDDSEGLFEDLDLGSSKLGKTESQKNEHIAEVLSHLDKIGFRLADPEADVLGDAYEYLPGQLFYSTRISVCLWFLLRNDHIGKWRAVSELEPALPA